MLFFSLFSFTFCSLSREGVDACLKTCNLVGRRRCEAGRRRVVSVLIAVITAVVVVFVVVLTVLVVVVAVCETHTRII